MHQLLDHDGVGQDALVRGVGVHAGHATGGRGGVQWTLGASSNESGFPAIWVLVPWEASVRAPGLAIHVRRGAGYREEGESRAFPGWKAEEIHRAATESPLLETTWRAPERPTSGGESASSSIRAPSLGAEAVRRGCSARAGSERGCVAAYRAERRERRLTPGEDGFSTRPGRCARSYAAAPRSLARATRTACRIRAAPQARRRTPPDR